MAFWSDQPTRTELVEWSFVPPGTPDMPFNHVFGSKTYELAEEAIGPLGEREKPRQWTGGVPPYPLPLVGPLRIDDLGLCGNARQWQHGSVASDPLPPLHPGSGIPVCCKKPRPDPQGGIAWGRIAKGTCGNAVGFPGSVLVTIVADPGFCTNLDGTYWLPRTVGQWEWIGEVPAFPGFPIAVRLICIAPSPLDPPFMLLQVEDITFSLFGGGTFSPLTINPFNSGTFAVSGQLGIAGCGPAWQGTATIVS